MRVCVCMRTLAITHFLLRKFLNVTHTYTSGQRCGSIQSASARKPPNSIVSGYYGNEVTPSYINGFGSCFVSDLESTEFYCL
jgi:hypothetical protein